MKRQPNYSIDLVDWAERMRGQEFVWGTTDCASLVRAALAIVYGEDVDPEAPVYFSEEEARQDVELGWSVRGRLLELGAKEVERSRVSVGDVVVAPPVSEEEFTDSAMIVVAPGKMLVTHPGTLIKVLPTRVIAPEAVALRLPNEW